MYVLLNTPSTYVTSRTKKLTYVKHALLDFHVDHALNVRLSCLKKTHVLRMLHIFLC